MEVIVDAANSVGVTNPEIHFILIGSGGSRAQLERRAANLANVEFWDEVDRPIIHGMLQASDCAVVSFHNNALYRPRHLQPEQAFSIIALFAPRSVIACEEKAQHGALKIW